MALNKTFVLMLALGLTACAMGPDFHSPKAPAVKAYTESPQPKKTASADGTAQIFESGAAIPAGWWTLFHSREINQLIETGLKNSPTLSAAQASLRQTKENLSAQEGALLLPNVSGQLGAQRQKLSGSTLDSTGSSQQIFNLYNASVNVAYTFDLFGANRRQLESLAAQVDYQRYQCQASYLTLTSNIVTTAINMASLEAQIKATNHLIEVQQAQLNITEKQLKLGGVSVSDVLAQQTQLAQTQASLPPMERSLGQARDALAVLVGAFPSNASIPEIQLSQLTLPKKLPLSLPSDLVRQRPDIQASEALLHAANAQVGVATANLFPQLTLSGNYGQSSLAAGTLFNATNTAWALGSSLTQPIFNGGSLRAQKRASVAAFERAQAQYQQTVLQAFQNVADTLKALETDALSVQAQQSAEAAAKARFMISQKQLRLGGVSYLAVLNADRQYQKTVINKIQAEATRLADSAALFQALGGGWWAGASH